MRVRVTRVTDNNWYKVGEEYEVEGKTQWMDGMNYYPLLENTLIGINPEHCEVIKEQPKYPFNVRCIDITSAEHDLVLNGVYTVTGSNTSDYYLKETPWSYMKSRFEIVEEDVVKNILGPQTYIPDPEEEKLYEQIARNKYMREVKPGVWVDVYDVLRAWNVVDPCLQHLLKKALASGQRGHKDLKEDLDDILASAKRAVEMYEEWNYPS